jgi:hypothetical protein
MARKNCVLSSPLEYKSIQIFSGERGIVSRSLIYFGSTFYEKLKNGVTNYQGMNVCLSVLHSKVKEFVCRRLLLTYKNGIKGFFVASGR